MTNDYGVFFQVKKKFPKSTVVMAAQVKCTLKGALYIGELYGYELYLNKTYLFFFNLHYKCHI